MASFTLTLGSMDLTKYTRVAPGEGLDLGQGDMLEAAFSDSPLFEGQEMLSLDQRNKELRVPLWLNTTAGDAMNQLAVQVNQQLRLRSEMGQSITVSYIAPGSTQTTYWTLVFGRFDPAFSFRETEHGYLGGILHLWVLPYAHTATQRSLGTYTGSAAAMVIPAASLLAAGGSLLGDVGGQLEVRVQTGSYVPDDGRVVVISAIPDVNYSPMITPSQFATVYLGTVGGASGALGSIAHYHPLGGLNAARANTPLFSIYLNAATAYAGDNRVLGLAKAAQPLLLQARDGAGNALTPGALASAGNGYQLIDYGLLRVPTWAATVSLNIYCATQIVAGPGGTLIAENPGGAMAAPGGTLFSLLEHGPVFLLPEARTALYVESRSALIAADPFNSLELAGPTGGFQASQSDLLGNVWTRISGTQLLAQGSYAGGNLGITPTGVAGDKFEWLGVGSGVNDAVVTVVGQTANNNPAWGPSSYVAVGQGDTTTQLTAMRGPNYLSFMPAGGAAPSTAIPTAAGEWTLRYAKHNGFLSAAYFWGANTAAASLVASLAYNLASANIAAGRATQLLQPLLLARATVANATNGGEFQLANFRARAVQLNSGSYQARDIYRLSDALNAQVRQTPSAADFADLQPVKRGQAGLLPVPSAGGGVFVGVFPFDQGPANDLLTVDVRVRERFTFLRGQ